MASDRRELVSPATIREWDRVAINEFGLPGVALMEIAGARAAELIHHLHGEDPIRYPEPFLILCGPGNNGGDGYVVARYLDNAGLAVRVRLARDRARRADSDAGIFLNVIERSGLEISGLSDDGLVDDLAQRCTVIDALLGTGLSRPLRSPYLEWIVAVRDSERSVIALDLPSGLDAETGEILGAVAPATHTITFAAPKTGFAIRSGPEATGEVHVVDIGLPRAVLEGRDPLSD